MLARHWFPLTGEQAQAGSAVDDHALVGRRATPVDPLSGPHIALGGRVVSMDDAFHVLPDGVLYIAKGRIVAAQPRADGKRVVLV